MTMLQRLCIGLCVLLPVLLQAQDSTDTADGAELMFVGDFERSRLQSYSIMNRAISDLRGKRG